jgi:cyclopropane fatty-acyl-phospholipid synthase-like methyltransferase
MATESHPYRDATFDGEFYVFPDLTLTTFPEYAAQNRADHYRLSSNQDRSLEHYNEGFGFDLRLLKGYRILELGAGMKDRFGEEATEQGLEVVSVNPLWQNQIEAEIPQPELSFTGNGHSISAIAQELPLQDGSVDAVISLWGVPAYLPGTKGEYIKAFKEIERVLTPGGFALLFPVPVVTAIQPAFKEVLNASFGENNYRLGDERGIPKLFYTKAGADEDTARFNDYLFSQTDRPTNPFIL